jgi:tRNA A37 threonylcarbamoyladenosine biosynthesis protein TsaE
MIEPDKELSDLEFKKLLVKNSIIAIEWADKIVKTLKKIEEDSIIVWVKIKYGKGEDQRLISWGNL